MAVIVPFESPNASIDAMVGLVAADTQGGAAVLYGTLAYAMMTLGAFSVVIAVGRRGERGARHGRGRRALECGRAASGGAVAGRDDER